MTDDNLASEPRRADEAPASFYEQVGGRPTFERLVHEFYRGVAMDDVLKPMYPEEDLGPAERRLLMFLEQYWGGPTTYGEERGHPRLRMRHGAFHVNPDARDRWLNHMRTALDALELSPLHEATLWDYLQRAAHAMVNTFEPTGIGPSAAGRDAASETGAGTPSGSINPLSVRAVPSAED